MNIFQIWDLLKLQQTIYICSGQDGTKFKNYELSYMSTCNLHLYKAIIKSNMYSTDLITQFREKTRSLGHKRILLVIFQRNGMK